MKSIRLKIKKISHRLTIVYAVLFFVALVSVNAATLFSVSYYMNQSSKDQLELINQAVKKEIYVLQDVQEIDLKNISQMNENIDINLIYDNKLIFETGERYNLPLMDNTNLKTVKSIEVGEKKIIYLSDKLILKDNQVIHVQIIKDLYNERGFLNVLFWIMTVMDSFIFIAAIIVGYIISKKALNPIDKITNQAKQISASDLTKRIKIEGPDDELKRLSDTFNDLIARIQYSYEKQNQFTLDVSHELATPLAVIKGYVDLIDRWGKEDREILDEGILSIKRELSNIIRLLDTLFFLSKSDNEILKLEKTTFWLNELIVEVLKESKLVTTSHDISSNINDSISIEADRRLIKQMLRAIIDNSIKYTAQNGKIEINSKSVNGQAEITISDNGTGISKEEVPHIFDRFYRVDKARSRELGGTGLGLSIVKWIVEIHGGSLLAESELNKGTQMIVRLPLDL
ncbi:ATP-binding protein [Paenibacillus sp. BR2-3]|uniref:sensor histidine kinase n=1 Tax=Paenibacillus sp. BR2-3 TaxID=3048494 RepID=UPI0039779F2E